MLAEHLSENMIGALEGFIPFTGSQETNDVVERWTKYERVSPDTIWPAYVGEGISIVLVRRPDKGTLGLVLRHLVDQRPLNDGKTLNKYDIIALKAVESVEAAEDVLRTIRVAYQNELTRDLEGFGSTPVEAMEDPAEAFDAF